MKNSHLIIFFSIFIFTSCDKGNSLFFDKKNIENSSWSYDNQLKYSVDIQDTSKIYTLLLEVNHSIEYAYQNMYFNIKTSFPSGKELTQVISTDLANKLGVWHGDCKGKKCKLYVNLQNKTIFNELGKHSFTLEQFTRDSSLQGIHSIAFRVDEYQILE